MYKWLMPVEEVERFVDREKYRSFFTKELDIEPVRYVVILHKTNKKELKRYLHEQGYNTWFKIEDRRGEDISATKGTGRYVIPGWKKMIEYFERTEKKLYSKGKRRRARLVRKIKLFLGSRYAPTEDRLHLKGWKIGEEEYAFTAHIDHPNWVTFPFRPLAVLRAHLRRGRGDYESGTKMFYEDELKSVEEKYPSRFKSAEYSKYNSGTQSLPHLVQI